MNGGFEGAGIGENVGCLRNEWLEVGGGAGAEKKGCVQERSQGSKVQWRPPWAQWKLVESAHDIMGYMMYPPGCQQGRFKAGTGLGCMSDHRIRC